MHKHTHTSVPGQCQSAVRPTHSAMMPTTALIGSSPTNSILVDIILFMSALWWQYQEQNNQCK